MLSLCFRLHFWLRHIEQTSWRLYLKVRRWQRRSAWRTFGSSWWTSPPLWTPFTRCTSWWTPSWTTRCDASCPRAFLRSDSIPLGGISTHNQHNSHRFFCICRLEFWDLAWIMQKNNNNLKCIYIQCLWAERRRTSCDVFKATRYYTGCSRETLS